MIRYIKPEYNHEEGSLNAEYLLNTFGISDGNSLIQVIESYFLTGGKSSDIISIIDYLIRYAGTPQGQDYWISLEDRIGNSKPSDQWLLQEIITSIKSVIAVYDEIEWE
jgi:hypothetical protein